MGNSFRGAVLVLVAAGAIWVGGSTSAEAGASDASASIIHGTPTKVSKWPWQVAIAFNPYRFRGSSRDRTFCGGVVLAPRLVLTARHCVARGYERWSRNLVVFSSRTWLENPWSGMMSRVRGIVRPSNPTWDVALLRLWQPVWAQPVRLASRSEYITWKPGQVAYSTGWGATEHDGPMSRRLRVSKQVIFPDGVCQRDRNVGRRYRPRLMVCHGSPTAKAGTCHGDSGGPLVVPVRSKQGLRYRLAGLTSFGEEYCWKDYPSVATRVSGDRLRNWIVRRAGWFSSADLVGSGARAVPAPNWCQVPDLEGLRVHKARMTLRDYGCYGARFEYDTWIVAPRKRVWATTPDPGWLLYPWAPFDVRVAI